MTTAISILADSFIPTTSFSGSEPPTVLRGANAIIRAASGRARIENYPGHKDLGENYDISTELITGTITYTLNSPDVVGVGTLFTTELHIGQKIQSAAGEPFVVNHITDDTHFTSDRPATTAAATQTATYLLYLCETNRQRAVLRRGNAITVDKKDIILVGDGNLRLNGVDTGFKATRAPKRLERENDGTYTEYPIGFPIVPTVPVMAATTGGLKGMQAGNYSFLFSWNNTVTQGYSNPSTLVKQDAVPIDLLIAQGGRFQAIFTNTLATKTFADGNVTIATGNIAITAHGLVTGDAVKVRNFSGALPIATGGGLVALKTYYAIRIDANNIKLARTSYLATAGTPIIYTSASGGGTHRLFKIPANADSILPWCSASGSAVTEVNLSNFNQGPWFAMHRILLSDLDSADSVYIEYLDGELGATVSGDNFAPPDCEWVTEFANTVQFVSCLGKTTAAQDLGTSPGNYVMPTKAINREGSSPDERVSVGDEITGFANAAGRMFCLTPTTVPFLTPTGRTATAGTGIGPFTSRPFWTKGGINPDNIIVVQGDVFIFTGHSLLRSPSSADPSNVVPFEISLPVMDLTESFADGFTSLYHDPFTNQLNIVSSATQKNTNGYWVSEILPFSLQLNKWQPIVLLSDLTRDLVVSGGATVNNRFEFLAGGRTALGAKTVSTWRYNEVTGLPVDWFIAWQPSDGGNELRQKFIKAFRVTGLLTNCVLQVFGCRAGESISIDDIEAGTNPLTSIPIPDSTGITREFRIPHLVKGLQIAGLRLSGTWNGSLPLHRVDEIVTEIGIHGTAQ